MIRLIENAFAAALFGTALLGTVLSGKTAAAQVEVGDPAPPYELTDWINHPPLPNDAFAGRVLALAFIRLEMDHCFEFLDPWRGLEREFALEPVSFLVVTNEAPNYVRGEVEREKLESVFAINPSDNAAVGFGVQAFPSVVILGPDGKVIYHDKPGNVVAMGDAIREALRFAVPFPPLSKKQKSITSTIEKWELGKAYGMVVKGLENKRLSDEDRQGLESTKVLMETWSKRMLDAGDHALEEKNYLEAVIAFYRLETEHGGIPGAEGAAAKLAALSDDPALKEEIDAAVEFAKANKYERLADWKKAQRGYESLSKRWPETAAGAQGAKLAEFLKTRLTK